MRCGFCRGEIKPHEDHWRDHAKKLVCKTCMAKSKGATDGKG